MRIEGMNRYYIFKKLVIINLVLLIGLSILQTTVISLNTDLPEPPDRPNTEGPLSGTGNTYSGGIIALAESPTTFELERDKVLGKIDCSNDLRTVEVVEKTDWGLSITGPISNSEMNGILEAIKDLRPLREVALLHELQGDEDEKRTWTHKGTIYEVIRYKIYIVRDSGPPAVNELVAILVTETPTALNVQLDSEPCTVPQPVVQVPAKDQFQALLDSIIGGVKWFFIDLPSDLGIFVFGTVKVNSGTSVAGVMHLRSGESKSIMLPPGSYTVQAIISVFGISFEWQIGQVSGDVPILLTVVLTTVETGAYILGAIIIIIVVIIVITIVKRIFRKTGQKDVVTAE